MLLRHMKRAAVAIAAIAICVLFALPLFARIAGSFPPGTDQFFDTDGVEAVPAADGGIWVLTPAGVVKYRAAGAGTLYPIPGAGTTPRDIVMAPDGSIWVANDTHVARLSTTGAILERYAIAGVIDLAVTSDGVLWYVRWDEPKVGRIVGGVPTPFTAAPAQAWNIAAATNGDVWLLGTGATMTPNNLYRMTPAGEVTTIPLGREILYGRLQTLPDGTLLISSGPSANVLRLVAGEPIEEISLNGSWYLGDAAGNIWFGRGYEFGYKSGGDSPPIVRVMPHDARPCDAKTHYGYEPLAIDSAGGVWVRVRAGASGVGTPFPCTDPAPPPLPDLIRIDPVQFLAAHAPGIPALSPAMLLLLALGLGTVALWHVRP